MENNHPLVKNVENVRDYTSNGDDRSKAKQLLTRIKRPRNLVTDTDVFDFLMTIDEEAFHYPQEVGPVIQ